MQRKSLSPFDHLDDRSPGNNIVGGARILSQVAFSDWAEGANRHRL